MILTVRGWAVIAGLFVCAAVAHAEIRDDYWAAHSQGNIQLSLWNSGILGPLGVDNPRVDPITGDTVRGCIYPRNSGVYYTHAWLVIGGVRGRDTLSSDGGFEMVTEDPPIGSFEYGSIDRSKAYFAEWANSELDLICQYTDTVTDPNIVPFGYWDNRPHKPLGLKITQQSMAWSADILSMISSYCHSRSEISVTITSRTCGLVSIKGLPPITSHNMRR
jgi:hypothetical protein